MKDANKSILDLEAKSIRYLLYALPIISFLLISILYIFKGSFWFDEGWYLLAAREVMKGKFLYRDFGYTQTPLFPYIYGCILKPIGITLLNGRILSFVISLYVYILCTALTIKTIGWEKGHLTSWLIGFNPFIIYFLTVATVHALATLFLTLSVFIYLNNNKLNFKVLSLFFMVLAVATRLTILPALVIIYLGLLCESNSKERIYLTFYLLIFSSILYMPYLLYHDVYIFNVLTYHNQWHMQGHELFLNKMLYLAEFQEYNIVILAFTLLIFILLLIYRELNWLNVKMKVFFSMVIIQCLFIISMRRFNPTYLANIMPLLIVAITIAYFHISKSMNRSISTLIVFAIVLLAALTGSVNISNWLSYREFHGRNISDPEYISLIAKDIRDNSPPNAKLLTLDTIVSIESDREVLDGCEMSYFAYYPEWSLDKAKKYHLLNKEILLGYLRTTTAQTVVLTEGSFDGDYQFGVNKDNHYNTRLITSEIDKRYSSLRKYNEYITTPTKTSIYVYIKK